MVEQEQCPVYCISKTRWDNCLIEEKLKARVAELESHLKILLDFCCELPGLPDKVEAVIEKINGD